MRRRLLGRGLALFTLMILVVINGCNNSPTGSSGGQVSLTVRNFSNPTATILAKITAPMAVDSIQITRARLLVSSIDFEGGDDQSDGDDMEFMTAPAVIELSMTDTVQSIAIANIPNGSYSEIEIEISTVSDSDLAALSPADLAPFADFIAGTRYSVIISGMVYQNGMGPQPFVFNSAIYAEQEYELNPPLVVSPASPTANVTLAVYSANWFVGPNGVLLDPTDPANRTTIERNLKQSIAMYEDDDRDGDDDDGDDDDGNDDDGDGD
ncbi:MAG: hypothetical protein ACREOO_01405 [bacterium]